MSSPGPIAALGRRAVDQVVSGLRVLRHDPPWRPAGLGRTAYARWIDAVERTLPPPGMAPALHGWQFWVLDGADVAPCALAAAQEAVARFPDAALLYADEDRLDTRGQRHKPWFKPAWNRELFRAWGVVGSWIAVRLDCLPDELRCQLPAQGFLLSYGAEDMSLRTWHALATVPEAAVIHIPRVLSHVRLPMPPDARTVQQHLDLAEPGACAAMRRDELGLQIRYPAPAVWPLIEVLIPTRDGGSRLASCLSTLRERTRYPNWRITVIDNGSVEPLTLELLQQLLAERAISVRLAPGPFNYAALNNEAVTASRADALLLLNDDVELDGQTDPGWLEEMVTHLCRPRVGAVGLRLRYPDGRLQHGGVRLGLGGVAGHLHPRLPAGEGGDWHRALLPQEVSAVTAACLLTWRAAWAEVGGLDAEHLPVSFNDVDYGLRLRRAGLRVLYLGTHSFVHHESASRGPTRGAARQRARAEATVMRARWGSVLDLDPAGHPALSLGLSQRERLCRPRSLQPRDGSLPSPQNAHPLFPQGSR